MTTAIDTNVLVALWNEDDTLNTQARSALDAALGRGSLVIAAPVFAELLAAPSRNEEFLDSFCRETGISIDWNFDKARLSTVSRPGRDKLYRAPTGKKLSLGLCG